MLFPSLMLKYKKGKHGMDKNNRSDFWENELAELFQEAQVLERASKICQNTNEKKISITDIAVSKIPYIKYPDMSIDDSIIIHELAEKVLRIAKEENDSNEVVITYDLDTQDKSLEHLEQHIGICKGNEHETDVFSDTASQLIIDTAKNIAVVNLHNHPNCSLFSIYDITFFLRYESIKMMVLLSNKGELYYMSKTQGAYNHNQAIMGLSGIITDIVPGAISEGKLLVNRMTKVELDQIAKCFRRSCQDYGIEHRHALGRTKEVIYHGRAGKAR